MSRFVVPGSIAAVAESNHTTLAEAFLGCEIMAIVDVSGSMAAEDSRGGKSRWSTAAEELTKLQASHPGKVGLIAFSDRAQFYPGGVLPQVGDLGGGTGLDRALEYAKIVDGTVRYVVVSDGQPDDEAACLRVAATMQSEIDCIFVGPEGGPGAAFLAKLARRKGGSFATAASADLLGEKIGALMLNGR